MNELVISGNLGQDAVNVQGNTKFSVAVNERRKAKSGDYESKTIWMDCFYPGASKVWQYMKKGDFVVVKGKVDINEYDGKKYFQVIVSKVELTSKHNEMPV